MLAPVCLRLRLCSTCAWRLWRGAENSASPGMGVQMVTRCCGCRAPKAVLYSQCS